MKILVLAALPQEYAPLKKLLPGWKRLAKTPVRKFSVVLPDKEILIVETGMGGKFGSEAIRDELVHGNPDLVIFAGFAGGLHADLPVGKVCFVRSSRMLSGRSVLRFDFPAELIEFFMERAVVPVSALTTIEARGKTGLASISAGDMAIVDMESAILADTAVSEKLPLICLRAVSDALADELGFDLRDITDANGRVKPLGVLKTVLTKPRTIGSFYLSWKRSRKAAKNLCETVADFLRIPSGRLGLIASQIRIERT